MRKEAMRSRRFIRIAGLILVLAVLGSLFHAPVVRWVLIVLQGKKTVADRVTAYGPAARSRLAADYMKSGVAYPPERVLLLGLKQERVLQVYAVSDSKLHYVRSYPILGASGKPGPKLREGDRQVPEGVYPIESLNPNSAYHLSLRIGYPNAFDREMARRDGRQRLGGDIMIHGGRSSAGCLAVGNEAAEDIFVLAADTGLEHIEVILSPVDFRRTPLPPGEYPVWTKALYTRLSRRLSELPAPDSQR